MRTYTIVVSVIAHVAAIAALIIAPALATDVLPEVQRTTAFIMVRAEMPTPPPTPIRPREPAPSTTGAPITEPDSIQPESLEPIVPADLGVDGVPASGIPPGDIVSTGDPLPPPAPRPKDPVHVGGLIQPPLKIKHVAPVYPPIALAARKEGLVILEALIAENGDVQQVRVLRSDALFDQAAITAVQQWKFNPTRLNGEPVPLVMTVTVGFTLTR